MDPVQVLKSARARIERGWCQGVWAKNAKGQETSVRGEDAVCWCAMGAVVASSTTSTLHTEAAVRFYLAEAVGKDVQVFNDTPNRKKEEVLVMFDKAIRLAETKSYDRD
jgi:hypothetical protein